MLVCGCKSKMRPFSKEQCHVGSKTSYNLFFFSMRARFLHKRSLCIGGAPPWTVPIELLGKLFCRKVGIHPNRTSPKPIKPDRVPTKELLFPTRHVLHPGSGVPTQCSTVEHRASTRRLACVEGFFREGVVEDAGTRCEGCEGRWAWGTQYLGKNLPLGF